MRLLLTRWGFVAFAAVVYSACVGKVERSADDAKGPAVERPGSQQEGGMRHDAPTDGGRAEAGKGPDGSGATDAAGDGAGPDTTSAGNDGRVKPDKRRRDSTPPPADSSPQHDTNSADVGVKPSGAGLAACNATPALSPAERSIARAYLGLLGRVPELAGLDHWRQQLGANPSLSEAAEALHGGLAALHAMPATYDNASFVEALYMHLLGKMSEDDPSGIAYWASALANTSRGVVLEQALQAALQTTDGAILRNRLTVLDCSVRLALRYGTTLRYQETFTVIQRVTADPKSRDAALDGFYDLVRPGAPARPRLRLESGYSPAYLFGASVPASIDGAATRHYRQLVWWNRDGDPLWAYAVLPPTYLDRNNWPMLVMAHGGGWREGHPDHLKAYAAHLAARGFVVIVPSYRLSLMPGYTTPSQQQDLADIVTILRASAGSLGINATHIGLIGLSAGGHLAALLGATDNYGCVAALFPPLDLSDPALIPDAPWYLSGYLAGASAASVSPTLVYLPATTTKFRIQHSVADPLVPHGQSVAFINKLGAGKATLLSVDSCPGSSATSPCNFHGPRGYLGADRTRSIDDLVTFFKTACGYN